MNLGAQTIKRELTGAGNRPFACSLAGTHVRPGFSPLGCLLMAAGYVAAKLFPPHKNRRGASKRACPVTFGGPDARWVPQSEVDAALSQHATAKAAAAAADAAAQRSVSRSALLANLVATSGAPSEGATGAKCEVHALWDWVLRDLAAGGPQKPQLVFAHGPWLAVVKYRGASQSKPARFMFLVKRPGAEVLQCVGTAPRSLFPHVFITQKEIPL